MLKIIFSFKKEILERREIIQKKSSSFSGFYTASGNFPQNKSGKITQPSLSGICLQKLKKFSGNSRTFNCEKKKLPENYSERIREVSGN